MWVNEVKKKRGDNMEDEMIENWDSKRREIINFFNEIADLEMKEFMRAAFAIDLAMMDMIIAEEKGIPHIDKIIG
jgi:hypothetical protein